LLKLAGEYLCLAQPVCVRRLARRRAAELPQIAAQRAEASPVIRETFLIILDDVHDFALYGQDHLRVRCRWR
jgi:hypothetical protein